MKKVIIYTDGACSGNPGSGGWGAILIFGEHEKEIFGGEYNTTNNRMELLAAIKSLESLKEKCNIELFTDSQYVKKGITEWLPIWKNNNWKNSQKKNVKNADLWKELDNQNQNHNVTWKWVKGHAGNKYNEIADSLARKGIKN